MDFYATIADKAALYLSFHCAAEMLLYPMGHTIAAVENKQDLVRILINFLLISHLKLIKFELLGRHCKDRH